MNRNPETPFTDKLLKDLGIKKSNKKPSAVSLNEFASEYPEEFILKTGITTAIPPSNIHRMQKKNSLWVGDLYSANLVFDALIAAKIILNQTERVLDLGCSSGSLIRVLRAKKDWKLFGCDPIKSSIEWASLNIPNIEFRTINVDPPLPYADESFSGITAISIWSHHSPDAAYNWLLETYRILENQGWIVLTFCGPSHISWLEKRGSRNASKISEIRKSINSEETFFEEINYKGEDSETGSNWGHSIYNDSFFQNMAKKAGFDCVLSWPGRNQGNQDVIVLRKK